MNPTVLAAAIGVGGTVIIGIGGVMATVRAAGTAMRGAREGRIWDQRAAVYVDAIAAVNFRQTARRQATSRFRDPWESEQGGATVLRNYQQPEWFIVEARLLAFGSDEVNNALREGSFEHANVLAAHRECQDVPPGSARLAARQRVEAMVDAADESDECLIDLISAELQARSAHVPWRGILPPDPQ